MKRREIKFRGRSSENGNWYYGYLNWLREDQDAAIFFHDGTKFGHNAENVDIETVGQFTGVKDWRNKDIYEGDIIIRESSPKVPEGFKGVVEYSDQSMSYIIRSDDNKIMEMSNSGMFGDEYGIKLTSMEVMGNIHQLKSGK